MNSPCPLTQSGLKSHHQGVNIKLLQSANIPQAAPPKHVTPLPLSNCYNPPNKDIGPSSVNAHKYIAEEDGNDSIQRKRAVVPQTKQLLIHITGTDRFLMPQLASYTTASV
jgi:hypothetical protein